MSKVMDVIVIGCGASGVAALRKLHDAGLKVIGLEAADRIGGRIKTVPFGESFVDIGAAWCHGEKDNIVFELANPFDLLGRPEPDNKWLVLSNGDMLPSKTGDDIINALNDALAQADKNNDRSISECLRDALKTNQTLQKDPEVSRSFIEWFERNNHVGGQSDPTKGKSLRGLEESWGCEGEFMLNWKGRGYTTIVDVLLNKYPDPSKAVPVEIHLKKEVQNIKYASRLDATTNPLVHVTCTDGSLYAAKSVIVTLSVACLKERHNQLFKPLLPEKKITAINTLQQCVLDKIYIEFEKPWWPKSPANFTILWREEDKQRFSENEKWITEIFGFQTVDYQPNLLLAWIYGEGAIQMEEVSLEGVETGVKKLMKVIFSQFEVTPIKSIVRSQWASDPYTRGAYAYRSVLTERQDSGARDLSEPILQGSHPVVCFAGEATSLHRHTAVHGAIEAGFREADRLIESLKKL